MLPGPTGNCRSSTFLFNSQLSNSYATIVKHGKPPLEFSPTDGDMLILKQNKNMMQGEGGGGAGTPPWPSRPFSRRSTWSSPHSPPAHAEPSTGHISSAGWCTSRVGTGPPDHTSQSTGAQNTESLGGASRLGLSRPQNPSRPLLPLHVAAPRVASAA